MKRKEWFKLVGLGGVATISNPAGAISAVRKNQRNNRVLRIAHMTDPHLDTGSKQEKWTRFCIHHIHNLDDRPDMIFNGGDTINDALEESEDSVTAQWKIWNRLKQEITIPMVH